MVFKDSDSGGDETYYWVKVLEEAASSKAVGGISWTAGGDNRGNLFETFFSWNLAGAVRPRYTLFFLSMVASSFCSYFWPILC